MSAGNQKLVLRKFEIIDIAAISHQIDTSCGLSQPEICRVQIPGYVHPYDFGSWCYTRKKKLTHDHTTADCAAWLVDLASFRPGRRAFVNGFLSYIARHIALLKSERSISAIVGKVSLFIHWCDNNNPEGLDSERAINGTLQNYSDHLKRKVRRGVMNVNTAAYYQRVVNSVMVEIFDGSNQKILQGVRRIRTSYFAINVTKPPSNEGASLALSTAHALFNQLTDFVIDAKPFPLAINLPVGDYWLFPGQKPVISKQHCRQPTDRRRAFDCYDLNTGTVMSVEKIAENIAVGRNDLHEAKRLRDSALRRAHIANTNYFHSKRILAATLAADNFIQLFAANTGMGLGQIISIPWSDNFSTAPDRLGFKTIKPRAKNKKTEFSIESGFFPTFRKYLKLREYLIESSNSECCDRLFFGLNKHRVRPLSTDYSYRYSKRLETLFNFSSTIGVRGWRTFKSHILLGKTSIQNTAMMLQNSVTTTLKHYASGSPAAAAEEFTKYFAQLPAQLIEERSKLDELVWHGNCSDVDNPVSIHESTAIQPDCAQPEGCLHCSNFQVHPDELDLRKLFSFQHILNLSERLTTSSTHADDLFSDSHNRIDSITRAIKDSGHVSAEAFERIHREVFKQEKLSDYWSRKLELLTELEVI